MNTGIKTAHQFLVDKGIKSMSDTISAYQIEQWLEEYMVCSDADLGSGQIAVNKKNLVNHCNVVLKCLNDLDEVMKEKESFGRGKKIAEIANQITFTIHSTMHFELGIDLKKLNNFIK